MTTTTFAPAADAAANLSDCHVPAVGDFSLRPLAVPGDMPLLHGWVTQEHARYWGMLDATLQQVTDAYRALQQGAHTACYLGLFRGEPAFLLECYDPAHDVLGEYYPVQAGDIGMHFLVAPPTRPIPGFTRAVMRVILAFLFRDPATLRVVVEPDVRNDKIHVINRHAGFVYQQELALPHKRAHLACCTREQHQAALQRGQ
ncbi:GNAT family N-acetyltransferase [Vogesella oryzae]|uniref:GNAT family N-acetyltransferase n=1 Tax=Vogesella oryzae TaxID=1735285 RepID=UPI0015821F91|nr:GNAT family N-acetyltransferase [Vogesella oryzae]